MRKEIKGETEGFREKGGWDPKEKGGECYSKLLRAGQHSLSFTCLSTFSKRSTVCLKIFFFKLKKVKKKSDLDSLVSLHTPKGLFVVAVVVLIEIGVGMW